MLYDVINKLSYSNIFNYSGIILLILLLINKLEINIYSIILILIIIFIIYLYIIYNSEKEDIIYKNIEYLDIDKLKYIKIYNIVNELYNIKEYNIYSYKEVLKYIKLFCDSNDNNFKIEYMNEILNILSSMVITLPINLDIYLQNIIIKLKEELKKDVKISIYLRSEKYDKNFSIY